MQIVRIKMVIYVGITDNVLKEIAYVIRDMSSNFVTHVMWVIVGTVSLNHV